MNNPIFSVYLHNPAHNGDVLASSQIVKVLVKSNPEIKFKIVPSCSSVLFEELVNDNVELLEHTSKWIFTTNYVENPDDDVFAFRDTLYGTKNNNLYINMWKLMLLHNSGCLDIENKVNVVNDLLEEIYQYYNFRLFFNAKCTEDLVPEIPEYDISFMNNYLPIHHNPYVTEKKHNKTIFFFNLFGCSGQDSNTFSCNFNDNYTRMLLDENPDSLIIIVDKSSITHPNVLSLTDDLKIEKMQSGKSLVLYANICKLCDEVHFKDNGGSLFFLNKVNIGKRNTKYFCLSNNDLFYNVLKNTYKLNCFYVPYFQQYN
jgi:hypothetical protein